MKSKIALAVLALSLATAQAQNYTNYPTDGIASNLAGYVLVPTGTLLTNTLADVGLASNTAYACIPVSELTYLTEAKAAESGGSSSYRALVFGFVKAVHDHLDGLASTNRPTVLTVTEAVRSSSSGDVRFTHSFDTDIGVSTAGVADEE